MPFSPFMDPQKKSEIIVVDQSALAKSAAWAWYEHGSGSDARPTREVDAWSSRPSRYKLELLRNLQLNPNYKNSLLDNYEIQRISQQLDRFIESTHAKFHGGDEVFRKKNTPRGFWWKHIPVCSSSRNDVVENRPQMAEKGCVAVVGDVRCRPRPSVLN